MYRSLMLLAFLTVGWCATQSESEALEQWQSGDRIKGVRSGLIRDAIENARWNLAKEMVRFAQNEGIDVSTEVRSAIASVHRETSELTKLLNVNMDRIQTLSPAFQWAESGTHVFIQVKLAYRWSSPGALTIESQNVTLLPDQIYFSGIGTHSNIPKLYELSLELNSNIIPEESEWNLGAVGKILITLKKETSGSWGNLTRSKVKIPNMHIWWEMKEKIEIEEAKIAAEAKAAAELAKKLAEEAANKTSTTSTSTTAKNEL